jgi:hypothetical protein
METILDKWQPPTSTSVALQEVHPDRSQHYPWLLYNNHAHLCRAVLRTTWSGGICLTTNPEEYHTRGIQSQKDKKEL